VRTGGLRAAHDVSDGGIACALAECSIAAGAGLAVDLGPLIDERGGSAEDWLFGEGPGGFVIAGSPDQLEALVGAAGGALIGSAGGESLRMLAGETVLEASVESLRGAWQSLAERM